jgi:hypothetical protein
MSNKQPLVPKDEPHQYGDEHIDVPVNPGKLSLHLQVTANEMLSLNIILSLFMLQHRNSFRKVRSKQNLNTTSILTMM